MKIIAYVLLVFGSDGSQDVSNSVSHFAQLDHCRYIAQHITTNLSFFVPVKKAHCEVVWVDPDKVTLLNVKTIKGVEKTQEVERPPRIGLQALNPFIE